MFPTSGGSGGRGHSLRARWVQPFSPKIADDLVQTSSCRTRVHFGCSSRFATGSRCTASGRPRRPQPKRTCETWKRQGGREKAPFLMRHSESIKPLPVDSTRVLYSLSREFARIQRALRRASPHEQAQPARQKPTTLRVRRPHALERTYPVRTGNGIDNPGSSPLSRKGVVLSFPSKGYGRKPSNRAHIPLRRVHGNPPLFSGPRRRFGVESVNRFAHVSITSSSRHFNKSGSFSRSAILFV